MINAAPTVTPPVATPPVVTPPGDLVPGYRSAKAIVFAAPYSDAQNWTNGSTSAFPGQGSAGGQVNPGDSKLDHISPNFARPTDAGVFVASKNPGGLQVTANGVTKVAWDTQLVTTESSLKGFKVKTGDVVAFDVTLPSGSQAGQWLGVWTWAGPSNELDFIETHGDNPTTAEFTNHVRTALAGYPKVITPGSPNHIEVVCGSTSVQWWVDGVNVFNDTGGVGSGWSAYLIANLSVAAGNQYHPGPTPTATTITGKIANLKVYR